MGEAETACHRLETVGELEWQVGQSLLPPPLLRWERMEIERAVGVMEGDAWS